jgi:hypothetical protein
LLRREIELEMAELQGVMPRLLWVGRQMAEDFFRHGKPLPAEVIPSQETAMEYIESGKLQYAYMPKSLEGWRLEAHGAHWVLVDPRTRQPALLPAPPEDHPMLAMPDGWHDPKDRLAEYRGHRREVLEPGFV